MQDLSIAEDIVPIGEFKANASRFLKRVRHGPRPLVITQNGRPAGVVLSPREYDRIVDKEQVEILTVFEGHRLLPSKDLSPDPED